jgi:hypothetical protein
MLKHVVIFLYFVLQASTIDGRRKGACLFCQEYFMDLYLLAELKTISLKVTTVDMQKPPPDFRWVTSQIHVWENCPFLCEMAVVHIWGV